MTKTVKIDVFDFSGGLNTKSSITSLSFKQASDLQNINILPAGGFEKRRGNSTFNSSAMNSGANIQGLGYYRQSGGTDYIVSICGNKVYKSDSLDGTMDDITGAVTITAGKDNIWTHSQIKDLSIFVGGPTSPDAPISWNGTGNMATLSGSPPSGSFGFTANNRMFIGNTNAQPSRIYWSVLGNPEDWTGTGSGSQDVGLNDGDTLVAGATVGLDTVLLFKQNSIWTLATRSAPFPLYGPVFRGVGAISKRGIVYVDGIIYFITSEPRMKATDGTTIYDFPDSIDDIWDGLNSSRLKYAHGIYNRRLNQIQWFVSSYTSTTNDLCLIWDLKRKCWLKHNSGQNINASVFAQDRTIYGGGYDGKIYKFDVSGKYSDDSNGGSAIDAYWETGWFDYGDALAYKYINYVDLNYSTQTSGVGFFTTGFNFTKDVDSQYFDLGASGGLWDVDSWDVMTFGELSDCSSLLFVRGNGKYIQHKIQNKNIDEPFYFNGFSQSVNYSGITRLN